MADFIDYWNEELEEMNKNERSSLFEYPQSFIDFAAFLKISFSQPYRQLKGAIKRLSAYNNYSMGSKSTTTTPLQPKTLKRYSV